MTESRQIVSRLLSINAALILIGAIMASKGTVIVTGGSQGIGAAVVQAFLDRGYSVVATSRKISRRG